MTNNETYFACPEGLSNNGKKAYKVICKYLKDNKLTDATSKVFYSPTEWRERGEEYGKKSELIVMYEEASAGLALSYDRAYESARPGKDCYALLEGLNEELRKAGLYTDQCTRWYNAVYKL